jgi:hypothetical protein
MLRDGMEDPVIIREEGSYTDFSQDALSYGEAETCFSMMRRARGVKVALRRRQRSCPELRVKAFVVPGMPASTRPNTIPTCLGPDCSSTSPRD